MIDIEDDLMLASVTYPEKTGRAWAQEVLTEHFGPFGALKFPYVKMGKIDSLHLFGDTELMLFALYWHNRHRWKDVLDIGANLGLHSICMARLGWRVRSYEPDHDIYQRLTENIQRNRVADYIKTYEAAVSTSNGKATFVRVLDNLTGSHLEGVKASYGPKQNITVDTVDCSTLWGKADFAKIDCEGNEAHLCKTLTADIMKHLDLVMEVRDLQNGMTIYNHFNEIGVPMWSQKIDWHQVTQFQDMPIENKDGSLFVGHRGPWA